MTQAALQATPPARAATAEPESRPRHSLYPTRRAVFLFALSVPLALLIVSFNDEGYLSRAELEALFPAMGTFFRAPRRVTQVAVPVRFDGQDVLIIRDQHARQQAGSFADHIRTVPRGRVRHDFFTSIPLERFLEEIQRRQPFMFHPQMNCDTTVPLIR